jgi:hypothetical protein
VRPQRVTTAMVLDRLYEDEWRDIVDCDPKCDCESEAT